MILSKTKCLLIVPCVLTACADWQTTPTVLDNDHGKSVRQMVQSQTLYPEHSQEPRQVLLLDGRKGVGIYMPYQTPASDLRKGKETVQKNIDEGNN